MYNFRNITGYDTDTDTWKIFRLYNTNTDIFSAADRLPDISSQTGQIGFRIYFTRLMYWLVVHTNACACPYVNVKKTKLGK